MNESIHVEKLHGCTIKIFRDEDAQSPQESGDDSLFLVGFHRDFYVLPPGVKRGSGRNDEAIFEDEREKRAKTHWIFGLEAYIHGGVSLSLSNQGNFPDRRWDVSQLGAVFVQKKYWRLRAKAEAAARSLINQWNNYLSGNVYGYQIEGLPSGEIDSCSGFYGDYDAKLYGALPEARALVNSLTGNGKTEANGQYLFPFAVKS